jgi:hypothetical protein
MLLWLYVLCLREKNLFDMVLDIDYELGCKIVQSCNLVTMKYNEIFLGLMIVHLLDEIVKTTITNHFSLV